jgi:hypothetical protein
LPAPVAGSFLPKKRGRPAKHDKTNEWPSGDQAAC